MKFNFKKVASVLAATIMLGSTVSFAAAAWPAPFVKDGASDSAVVYGASSPTTGGDKAAAIDLGAELDKSITATVSAGSSTDSGDSFMIQKTNDKFNLGDSVDDFYSTLDSDQLSKVLADGVYTNDDNDEFEYEQTIAVGDAMVLTHFLEDNDDFAGVDIPTIGFQLGSGDDILNYTLEFTPDDADNGIAFGSSTTVSDSLETTNLEMLGMSYYIQKVETTSTGVKMTLLDNANEAVVSEGEDKTVTVGDNSYNVKISFVDEDETILEVNGVKTNKITEGGVFKIGSDTYVAVKSILYNSKESGISQVEFSIGSGKIVLQNGQEVQMNGEDISDIDSSKGNVLNAYFINTTDTISEITLEWVLDDDAWIAPGTDLVLPGFETIKFSEGAFTAPKAESTVLKASDDDTFEISTEITDGAISLPILYLDDDISMFSGYGEKSTHKLNIRGDTPTFTLNETENSMFVVSWIDGDDAETYAFEIESITDDSGKNSTTLKNLAGGSDITFSEVGDDKEKGSLTFTLAFANDNSKIATVAVTNNSGNVRGDRIVSEEGLTISLTAITAANNASKIIRAIEEDPSNGNLGTGAQFDMNVTVQADDGAEVSALLGTNDPSMLETEDGSKVYEGYVVSDMATKLVWDKPTNDLNELEIVYAGDESYAAVYIAEASATVGSVKDSVKVVTDAEVDSVKSKNLIVVGGSCINTVAAKMLGSETAICGDAWASQTGAGPGKYLIQVAASPVNAEKIAMLIAGYETADTANAVAVVKEGDVSTEIGKIVGPVTASP